MTRSHGVPAFTVDGGEDDNVGGYRVRVDALVPFDTAHEIYKLVRAATEYEAHILAYYALPAKTKEKFLVETTVYVEIEAESLDALMKRMADEGWTVFTLLDKGASSGDMIIRNEFNDVVGEL